MAYTDKAGNRTEDIQNAVEVNERDYNQAITDKVAEYVASDDDLNDVIINDENFLSAMRAFYRAHTENLSHIVFATHARTACMHIDSYLINRAVKELDRG